MKHTSKIAALVAAMLAVVASSCGTDDPAKELLNDSFEQYFAYCVGKDQSGNDKTSSILPVDKISLSFNDDAKRATVTLQRLAMGTPSQFNYVNLTMTDLPFTANEHGHRLIVADNVEAGDMKIERVSITYYPDRDIDGTIYHGLWMRLLFNQANDMTFLPRESVSTGASEITTKSTGGKYVSTEMRYVVGLNPEKRTAVIAVPNPDFDPRMPALGEMRFSSSDPASVDGVPLRLQFVSGGYRLSADTIVPTIDGVPYPRFKITGLDGRCNPAANEMELEFDCAGLYHVSAGLSGCYSLQPNPVVR